MTRSGPEFMSEDLAAHPLPAWRFGAILLVLVVAMAFGLMARPARGAECGGAQAPCQVPLGTYHVAEPPGPAPSGGRPLVVFFHGFGGSGSFVLPENAITAEFIRRGYVVIGPNGLPRPGRFGGAWSFMPERPGPRDEQAFVHEVLADATARFAVDAKRILFTGFSNGGSLVWYLACKEPGIAAAYAPLAGGFWRPHPKECAGPIDLHHTHGWRDQQVPLEGRPLGSFEQGDIFEGLLLWRKVNGCRKLRADSFSTGETFWQRAWTSCEGGRQIVLALHTGDHDGVPMGWAGLVADWFEALQKSKRSTH